MQQLVEFIGNHPILATAWVILAVLIIYSYIEGAFSPVKQLSTREVTLLINKEDGAVVDIRSKGDFKKGHILGATHLAPEAVSTGDFSKLEKLKNKPIIVVCAMGMTAKRTALQMLKAGFSQVTILKGGMGSWQAEGLPIKK